MRLEEFKLLYNLDDCGVAKKRQNEIVTLKILRGRRGWGRRHLTNESHDAAVAVVDVARPAGVLF